MTRRLCTVLPHTKTVGGIEREIAGYEGYALGIIPLNLIDNEGMYYDSGFLVENKITGFVNKVHHSFIQFIDDPDKFKIFYSQN